MIVYGYKTHLAFKISYHVENENETKQKDEKDKKRHEENTSNNYHYLFDNRMQQSNGSKMEFYART